MALQSTLGFPDASNYVTFSLPKGLSYWEMLSRLGSKGGSDDASTGYVLTAIFAGQPAFLRGHSGAASHNRRRRFRRFRTRHAHLHRLSARRALWQTVGRGE